MDKNEKWKNYFQTFLNAFVFLLPWQTIYIVNETFVSGIKQQWGTLGFFFSQGIFWISVVCFLVYIFLQKKNYSKEILKTPVYWIFIFFFFFLFIGVFWSLRTDVYLQSLVWFVQAFLLVFFLSSSLVDKKQIVFYFLFGGAIQGIFGIGQFFLQDTFASKWFGLTEHLASESGTSVIVTESGRYLRAYGAFSHPNIYGGYLVLTTIITVLFIECFKKKNIFFSSVLVIQVLGVFFSMSRSAWMSLICFFLGFIFWKIYKKEFLLYKNIFLTLFCVLLFCIIAFFPLVKTRIVGNTVYETQSIAYRVSGYTESLQVFAEQPWLGVGIGNYTFALEKYFPSQSVFSYAPVHNVFLLGLVEFGIIGSLLFLSMCLLFFYTIKKRIQFPFLFVWISISCLPFFLFDHFFFSSYVGMTGMGVFVGIVLGLLTKKWE
ncbi:MAG: O-antigen ligase family protein [Candidatus Magasanikbacteria bacterium]